LSKVPIPDSTKALLVVVVPLLSAIAIGVALIVAFGEDSGGAASSMLRPSSPPTLPISGVGPATTTATGQPCSPRQPSATSLPPGPGAVTVTPDPTSLTAIWIPGLDPNNCRDATTRGARAFAVALATALNSEPRVAAGIYHCPMDDGSSVVLYFGYSEGHAMETVTVALSGCRFISDPGRTSRWWIKPASARPSFAQLLATIAPSPWHANILAALQSS
jgi:hypothetical protein